MAKKTAKNSYVKFTMDDGEEVLLTLTFIALLKAKQKAPAEYAKYNEVAMKGAKDELDGCYVIFMAYLCGIVMEGGEIDQADDFEEFVSRMPCDREYIGEVMRELMQPKKAKASENRS